MGRKAARPQRNGASAKPDVAPVFARTRTTWNEPYLESAKQNIFEVNSLRVANHVSVENFPLWPSLFLRKYLDAESVVLIFRWNTSLRGWLFVPLSIALQGSSLEGRDFVQQPGFTSVQGYVGNTHYVFCS